MNSTEKRTHILSSPDCRQTKDFDFTPFTQARDESGFSGNLLFAVSKTDPTERYIIKHSSASDPANEFVYYKIAAAVGALMPEIKLFAPSVNTSVQKFESRYICGSRYIECQMTNTFDEMLERAVNPQSYFYHCALETLFDQYDKLQFLLDMGNQLYHIDAAQSFNIDNDMMTAAVGSTQQDRLLWSMLYTLPFNNAKSNYWSVILASTSWIEDFRSKHGDKCVRHLLHPFCAIQEIPDSYIDGFLDTLCCFYPDKIGDYYWRFLNNAQQAAGKVVTLIKTEYASILDV